MAPKELDFIESMGGTPQAYLDRVSQLLAKPTCHKPFAIRYEPPAVEGNLLRVQTVIDPQGDTLQVLAKDARGEMHRATATRSTWRAVLAELIEKHISSAAPAAPAGGPTPDRVRRPAKQPKVGETLFFL